MDVYIRSASETSRAKGVPPLKPQRRHCRSTKPRRVKQLWQNPKKKRLTRVVAFRLPEDEYQVFIGKARAAGQSQTEFFRTAVLQNKTEVLVLLGVPYLLSRSF